MSFIDIKNIWQEYGDHVVLERINLQVKEGEFCSLVGASGCGKSTFLRLLLGQEKPTRGSITLDGEQLRAEPDRSRGVVFQRYSVFPHLNVLDNVAFGPIRVRGASKEAARQLARELLGKVGLAERAHHFPSELSGGQQQRVAIARALAMSPKVLLCDEITSALDPELVGEVLKVLEQLAAEGMTLILVTHEMNFAREVGDRVVFMHQGRVWEQGDSKTLFASPQTSELKQFISSVRGLN